MQDEPTVDFNLSHQLLDERKPIVPSSTPPDIESLRDRVMTRRKHRHHRRLFAGAMGAVCVVAVAASMVDPDTRSQALQRSANSVRSAATKQSHPSHPKLDSSPSTIAQQILPESDLSQIASVRQIASGTSSANSHPRAFLRVRQPVPLFGIDEATQTVHHVGWTSSDETLPVDVSQFSEQQQAAIEAVLRGTPASSRFNL